MVCKIAAPRAFLKGDYFYKLPPGFRYNCMAMLYQFFIKENPPMKKTVLFLLACIIFPLLLHGQQLTLPLDWQPYVGDMMIPVDLSFKV